jgi:hypothetical protein
MVGKIERFQLKTTTPLIHPLHALLSVVASLPLIQGTIMQQRPLLIKINPQDNVAIVVNDGGLAQGTY